MTTRSLYYDRDGEPLELVAWAQLHADYEYKRVAKDILPDGKEVSTVWIGLDHNFSGHGPPIIFETMVFPSADDFGELATERYATSEQATAGHDAMVREWTQ